MNNNKFKTVLCKHFGQNGTCSYGDKCQFAHGYQEIKSSNMTMGSTMPPTTSPMVDMGMKQQQKTIPNPSNFKIVKCKNWETTGTCKYGSVCTFAHGDTELRTKTENTQKMSENSILMDTGFVPNNMNPYLMQDPSYMYNMMMQNQMMSMGMGQMNPEMMKMYGMGNDMMGQMGYSNDVNLNENNMFFQQGMQPQDYSNMNYDPNSMNMNMMNMQNNSNMYMGGKP